MKLHIFVLNRIFLWTRCLEGILNLIKNGSNNVCSLPPPPPPELIILCIVCSVQDKRPAPPPDLRSANGSCLLVSHKSSHVFSGEVKQGGNISPVLFNVCIDDLGCTLNLGKGVSCRGNCYHCKYLLCRLLLSTLSVCSIGMYFFFKCFDYNMQADRCLLYIMRITY